MPLDSPKVSVCIPTYNHARFLPETLDSVLKQDFADCEILVIDDCSTDDTKEIIMGYSDRDKRIRVKINTVNIGMVNNWNLCLKEAKGFYIKYLMDDDLLASKDVLQKMVSPFDANPHVALVGLARSLIDSNSSIVGERNYSGREGISPGKAVINRCLSLDRNIIGEPSAVMFRKKDADRGFLPKYRQIVDMEMWFHLLEKGDFLYIDEPLCSFRLHPGQQTKKNLGDPITLIEDSYNIFSDYINKPYITINSFHKHYIYYELVHRIWKTYKKGVITKIHAVEKIDLLYGYRRFCELYLPYRLFRPFLHLYRGFTAKKYRYFN